MYSNLHPSVVTPVNKEQLISSVATISCNVRGLTRRLDAVKWIKSDDSLIESGNDGYTITEGVFIRGGYQVTTLTVPGPLNNRDTVYRCLLTSREHGLVDKATDVILKVFCKL